MSLCDSLCHQCFVMLPAIHCGLCNKMSQQMAQQASYASFENVYNAGLREPPSIPWNSALLIHRVYQPVWSCAICGVYVKSRISSSIKACTPAVMTPNFLSVYPLLWSRRKTKCCRAGREFRISQLHNKLDWLPQHWERPTWSVAVTLFW